MSYKLKNRGFSLTEVLLSVGILSVGMIFIAGVFPVGIHFTTIATERTIAAIVADEAFAKIRIYAIGDPCKPIDFSELEENELACDFNDIFPAIEDSNSNEFVYPSTETDTPKQYCWSALCRRVGADPNSNSRLVQVTVFVSRKVGSHLEYYDPHYDWNSADSTKVNRPTPDEVDWPVPVKVEVDQAGLRDNELRVKNFNIRIFINDGYTIVDDATGRIYRVLERYTDDPDTILLDRKWEGSGEVWVVPPPVNGSRYPCIAVYQKVIRF